MRAPNDAFAPPTFSTPSYALIRPDSRLDAKQQPSARLPTWGFAGRSLRRLLSSRCPGGSNCQRTQPEKDKRRGAQRHYIDLPTNNSALTIQACQISVLFIAHPRFRRQAFFLDLLPSVATIGCSRPTLDQPLALASPAACSPPNVAFPQLDLNGLHHSILLSEGRQWSSRLPRIIIWPGRIDCRPSFSPAHTPSLCRRHTVKTHSTRKHRP